MLVKQNFITDTIPHCLWALRKLIGEIDPRLGRFRIRYEDFIFVKKLS
jgi:hypothetical protein